MKETVDFSKLISDATSGDSSAFEELYKLSLKTAYHTASLLLKNPDDVEDVLQNTYIKAYQKLPELKNPESFESWIKTIVENECKNYIKKEKRFSAPLIFFKNKVEEYSEEWKQPVPQEYVEREELRKNVSDILNSLSPEVRACIVLFHYEQKSLNEISEILDIPLGTVKSRLHNGRKQIEKEFNKLRKKDPTLFGIGAIPVILSLLSYQAENIAAPTAIYEGIIPSASVGASTASAGSAMAGATAASTVAASGAATVTTSVVAKVVAVAVAGSVAVGGAVAVKNHIDNKPAEHTTAYSTTCKTEEACTISENLNEILTTLEESTSLTTSSSPSINITTQTEMQTVTATSAIQTSKSTTKNRTTTKVSSTVTKPTTTLKPTTTTKITTTTASSTTIKENTTEKSTTEKPTTTIIPPTTSSENNYSSSGGVITEYTGSDTNVSIPSSIGSNIVTAIGSGAFAGNTDIKSVSLPSSVTQIGQEAFADCSSLSSVSLPSSLELIGIGAFYGCSNLTAVSVPSGTKTIGDEAFALCSSLQIINIPASVTSISDDAFDGCNSLTIKCEKGSAAHDFAVANEIDYILV